MRAFGAAGLLGLWLPAWGLGAAAPFEPPSAGTAAGSEAAALPVSGAAGTSGASAMLGLSGIRLGTQTRALIDGQWLAIGATVRGATLLTIHADAVQLRLPDGNLQRLELTPQVELRHHLTAAPAPTRVRAARSTQAPSP